jgi:cyclic pyranopterin phosphate synthase
MSAVTDILGRPLRDLRISVTDRCNMRCTYCMPAEVFGPDYAFVPREEILSFEEIARAARMAGELGVRKIRLTGGEPLLRRDLPLLVRMLAALPSVEDLALTTNGLLLSGFASELRAAGLHRVTVSLDALDDAIFRRLGGSRRPVDDVLSGLAAAAHCGLGVKVNCVVQRGLNESEVIPLAEFCRSAGYTLRFIEYMDVGNHNRWQRAEVVPASELRALLDQRFGLVPLDPFSHGETARRYRYADGRGEVGLVASVTEPFCRDCHRARLTVDGKFVTCLFAADGTDLRGPLRAGLGDEAILALMRGIWSARDDRYSELRGAASLTGRPKIEMSYVGG